MCTAVWRSLSRRGNASRWHRLIQSRRISMYSPVCNVISQRLEFAAATAVLVDAPRNEHRKASPQFLYQYAKELAWVVCDEPGTRRRLHTAWTAETERHHERRVNGWRLFEHRCSFIQIGATPLHRRRIVKATLHMLSYNTQSGVVGA